MRHLYFLVALLFFYTLCTAQVTNLVFIGSVGVNDGRNYPYKLYVTDSADIITGYSVTDILGEDETKTYVRGKLDRSNKQLTFRETRIAETRSKAAAGDFCFIHARLKVGTIQGASTLKGSFTGYKTDGKTSCAKGKIVLVCAQDALNKLMQIAEKENTKKRDDTTEAALPDSNEGEGEIRESSVMKVEPGETIILKCPKPMVTLEIWDAKTLDGDKVTLMRGENVILTGYTISSERKKILVPMGEEKSIQLRLQADTEGSLPVNTARIKVTSGERVYFIDASTVVGKSVTILLNRK